MSQPVTIIVSVERRTIHVSQISQQSFLDRRRAGDRPARRLRWLSAGAHGTARRPPPRSQPWAPTEAPTEVPDRGAHGGSKPKPQPRKRRRQRRPPKKLFPRRNWLKKPPPASLESGTRQVAEFVAADGSATAPVADAIITFQNGQITGNGGCNGFRFAGYTPDGNALGIALAAAQPWPVRTPSWLRKMQSRAGPGCLPRGRRRPAPVARRRRLGAAHADGTDGHRADRRRLARHQLQQRAEAVVGMLEGTEITAIFGEDGSVPVRLAATTSSPASRWTATRSPSGRLRRR